MSKRERQTQAARWITSPDSNPDPDRRTEVEVHEHRVCKGSLQVQYGLQLSEMLLEL